MLRSLMVVLMMVSAIPQRVLAGESCDWNTTHDCPWQCWYDKHAYGGSTQPGDNVTILSGPNTGLTAANAACAAKRNGIGIPIRSSAVGGYGKILFAEDFDDPGYTNQTSATGGWGHCGTLNGSVCFRGQDSAWYNRYLIGESFGCDWKEGYPTGTPINGSACNTSTGQGCGTVEWTSGADTQPMGQGGSSAPCMDIFGAGQAFNVEDSALGVPDCPGVDGLPGTADDDAGCLNDDGVFDGTQALRYRNDTSGNTAGFITFSDPFNGFGSPIATSFGANYTTVGVTTAYVYPDNQGTSNIMGVEWKHEEFIGANLADEEYWVNGGSQGTEPLGGFIFAKNLTDANAVNLVNSASCAVGSMELNNTSGFANAANLNAVFTQSTDFPWGKWVCIQAKIEGMGTSSTRMRKWLNGTLSFDCTYNGTYQQNAYYRGIVFGDYANRAFYGSPEINQLSGRGVDNYVVTDGAPVSCTEIGSFAPEGQAPTPYPGSKGSGSFTLARLLERLIHPLRQIATLR